MSLMLATTIGCAFLTSVFAHKAGLMSPLVRYPMAILIGWGVFLLLLSAWVWQLRRAQAWAVSSRQQRRNRSSTGDGVSWPTGDSSSPSIPSNWVGDGGQFGGGGASESFADVSGQTEASNFLEGGEIPLRGGHSSGGLDVDVDFGDDAIGVVVLLIGIVVVAAAVFGVAFYAVYSAPTFFAEFLIDGGVGTWLYKRADVAHRPDWLTTAVRRSVLPVVILLAMFIGLALVMQHVAPGATTVGEAWRMAGGK